MLLLLVFLTQSAKCFIVQEVRPSTLPIYQYLATRSRLAFDQYLSVGLSIHEYFPLRATGGGHYHDDAIYSLVKLVSRGLMVLRDRSTLTLARQNSLCSSAPLHSISRGETFYCPELYSSPCLFSLVGLTNLIFFRKMRTQLVLLLLLLLLFLFWHSAKRLNTQPN